MVLFPDEAELDRVAAVRLAVGDPLVVVEAKARDFESMAAMCRSRA